MSGIPRMVYLRPGVDPRSPDGRVWGDALEITCRFVAGVFKREKQQCHERSQRALEDEYLDNNLPKLLRRQAS